MFLSSSSLLLNRTASCAASTRTSFLLKATTTRFMSSVINLSDESAVSKFKTINNKSILYFTATWCPPCKMIAPIYDTLAKEHPSVAFGKVDVDENQDAAIKFEISAVPTFVMFDKEEVVDRFSGADQNQLKSLIEKLEEK
eukprot:CAMPEP_0204622910 /NCGR_PEP_ID=MMETSP0717-20131115/8631_1 /ASSEMBLY_ACC=CAM_ASM_000666 /TAXON_ID=230516 /ORGANISM="Chaetoceros curvisetus" /LENGTH=140 /DNA_ID=CAMNT_0051637799 /DNA_START=1 /DNA_END=423 /DNA_ORIENTATION=-